MNAVAERETDGTRAGQARRLDSTFYNLLARNEVSDREFEQLIRGVWDDPEAVEEFRSLIRREPRVESALVSAIRDRDEGIVEIVLALLIRCDGGTRVVTSLLPYTQAVNPRIRSLASTLVARRCPSLDWVRQAMRHSDARVRADVLDSAPASMLDLDILEVGLRDSHHRVVGTAALRMLEFDEDRGIAALRSLTSDDRVEFRAAGVWAVGQSGLAALLDIAESLRHDPAPQVRWSARRAMVRLRHAVDATAP